MPFLTVSVTVVLGWDLAYFEVTNLPDSALRLTFAMRPPFSLVSHRTHQYVLCLCLTSVSRVPRDMLGPRKRDTNYIVDGIGVGLDCLGPNSGG